MKTQKMVEVPSACDVAKEALNATEALNAELFDQGDLALDAGISSLLDYMPFQFSSDGMNASVSFLGQRIWCSADDGRSFDHDDAGNPEPLEDYLRREASKILSALKGLSL